MCDLGWCHKIGPSHKGVIWGVRFGLVSQIRAVSQNGGIQQRGEYVWVCCTVVLGVRKCTKKASPTPILRVRLDFFLYLRWTVFSVAGFTYNSYHIATWMGYNMGVWGCDLAQGAGAINVAVMRCN